jgi:hypothetical protein
MPKGPKGQRRPADVVSNAIRVAQIATGEADEDMPKKRPAKSEAAAELGKLGGAARAKSLSAKKRSEIAKKAAAKRWSQSWDLPRVGFFLHQDSWREAIRVEAKKNADARAAETQATIDGLLKRFDQQASSLREKMKENHASVKECPDRQSKK